MKKAFLLLALLVSLLVSCNKQDPNEAFVGNYQGSITMTPKISALGGSMAMEPQTQPVDAVIVKGDASNEILTTFIIDGGTSKELRGVITDKNTVTFDPINFDDYLIEEELEDIEIVTPFTMMLSGTLSQNCLNLTGNVTGAILLTEDPSLPAAMPVNITIDITGALNKITPTIE